MFNPRTIYLRHTAIGGGSYVQAHRVWDAERFIAAQRAAASDLNAEAIRKSGTAPGATFTMTLADAEQITEEQFLQERTK